VGEETVAKRRPKPQFNVAPPTVAAVIPDDVITIDLAVPVFGLSRSAMEMLIYRGQRLEGKQYHPDPRGCVWVDRRGVRKWIIGEPR
jgi:hypothetical protein